MLSTRRTETLNLVDGSADDPLGQCARWIRCGACLDRVGNCRHGAGCTAAGARFASCALAQDSNVMYGPACLWRGSGPESKWRANVLVSARNAEFRRDDEVHRRMAL